MLKRVVAPSLFVLLLASQSAVTRAETQFVRLSIDTRDREFANSTCARWVAEGTKKDGFPRRGSVSSVILGTDASGDIHQYSCDIQVDKSRNLHVEAAAAASKAEKAAQAQKSKAEADKLAAVVPTYDSKDLNAVAHQYQILLEQLEGGLVSAKAYDIGFLRNKDGRPVADVVLSKGKVDLGGQKVVIQVVDALPDFMASAAAK